MLDNDYQYSWDELFQRAEQRGLKPHRISFSFRDSGVKIHKAKSITIGGDECPVKLDKINQAIIALYQDAERRVVKPPSPEQIAQLLHKRNIADRKYSAEGIRQRIKKLKQAGLIGKDDDRRDRPQRWDPADLDRQEPQEQW